MKYPLIVFDWDGTLYDSSAYIVNSVQDAARDVGLIVPEAESIRNLIGLSSKESVKYLFPNITAMEMANLTQSYKKQLSSSSRKPTLFEGSEQVICDLVDKGHTLSIATGKGREGLNNDLQDLQLAEYFTVTRCADECFSKPHPQMLLEILEQTQFKPEQALVVGDTEYDMELAKNVGSDALAVAYGVHHLSRLGGEHVIGELHDIRDIHKFLQD